MKSKCWIEVKSKFFGSIKNFAYHNGRLSNYLEKTIIDNSKSEDQINYCRYIDEELYAIIICQCRWSIGSYTKYVSHVRNKEGFEFKCYYSNDIDELKLKIDLYLIEIGFNISFPGV